jgi:hypothetical protein
VAVPDADDDAGSDADDSGTGAFAQSVARLILRAIMLARASLPSFARES